MISNDIMKNITNHHLSADSAQTLIITDNSISKEQQQIKGGASSLASAGSVNQSHATANTHKHTQFSTMNSNMA